MWPGTTVRGELSLSSMGMDTTQQLNQSNSGDINLVLTAQTTTSQEEFLNNSTNKSALTKDLSHTLSSSGVEVVQAQGDADLLIAMSAIHA